ncbi:MAG TPA: hypothetical protein VMU33_06055 [Burkholderiaceae bacterium]|nr:hypothetical protein [Burkholderiaceae bacterium]
MIYPIVRMYESASQATAAVDALKARGFDSESINLVTPAGADGAPASLDSLTDAIAKGWVLKSQASAYAAYVQRGRSLVSVNAPFGAGAKATKVLDSFNPVDTDAVKDGAEPITWDEAAPFSSAFWIPLLAKDAAPFSSFWNIPTLSRSATPFSSMFGLPTVSKSQRVSTGSISSLSGKAGIFSSMLGLPLLSKSKAGARK